MLRILLVAGLILAVAQLTSAQGKPSDPHEIIKRYLRAVGGRTALAAIHDRTVHGKILVLGMTGNLVWHEKVPNKMHQDVDLGMARSTTWFDGTRGYRLDPMLGTGPFSEADVKEASQSFVIAPLLEYEKHGWKARYLREDTVQDRPVDVIEITDGLGRIHTYWFDRETSYLLKLVTPQPVARGEGMQEIVFSDYREVAGVKFPFKMHVTTPTVPSEMVIESMEVNTYLPDSVFRYGLDPRTILERNLEAIGGAEAWQKLSSIHRTARLHIGEMTGETLSAWQAPFGFYHRVDLGEFHHRIGSNGETGWMNDQPATEVAVRNWKTYAYLFGSRYLLPGGITQAQYRGTEKVGDRETDVVEVTLASGDPVTCFFDRETHLLLKDISRHSAPGIDNVLIETLYEDYRPVGPIQLPFRFREVVPTPPIVAEFEVTEYKLDAPVEVGLFKPEPVQAPKRP